MLKRNSNIIIINHQLDPEGNIAPLFGTWVGFFLFIPRVSLRTWPIRKERDFLSSDLFLSLPGPCTSEPDWGTVAEGAKQHINPCSDVRGMPSSPRPQL